ncbi:PAS domain-containing protein [Sulfitobacter sp. D35]|uniref:PAS domain-containing protein n=1 Tax=Sulfitobacter sp. D35 TaxID=3083252 RepID=UPI00296E53F9|nr:PAS domain-containing protein [Sulfitobacter sp. D35]MDW4496524.1 PAS domain-containing protein [Sulfitobacter sp. D35]
MSRNVSQSGYSPLAQVEAYWEGLRGGRLMPNRAEIDPRGIENALEYAFIVERIAPGIARLRIAGSHLSDLMGMEVRGMPLTSFINPSSRRQVGDLLEEVFETPACCTLRLSSPAGAGAPAIDARMLLLPLKSDLGDVSRILGALVAVGDMGRGPRRFDIAGSAMRPIVAGTVTPARADTAPEKPTHAGLPAKTDPAPGFGDAAAPFRSQRPPRPAKGRPHLRLVKSDD